MKQKLKVLMLVLVACAFQYSCDEDNRITELETDSRIIAHAKGGNGNGNGGGGNGGGNNGGGSDAGDVAYQIAFGGIVTNDPAFGVKYRENKNYDIISTNDCEGPYTMYGIDGLYASNGCYPAICASYSELRQFDKRNDPGRVAANIRFYDFENCAPLNQLRFSIVGEIQPEGLNAYSLFPAPGDTLTILFDRWRVVSCDESGCSTEQQDIVGYQEAKIWVADDPCSGNGAGSQACG